MSSVLGRGVDRAVAFWVGEKGEAGHLDVESARGRRTTATIEAATR
jgi:hypothetical protein